MVAGAEQHFPAFSKMLNQKKATHILVFSIQQALNSQSIYRRVSSVKPTSNIMAQHSHVPKFGNWESDNVPYTAYFENAHREKCGTMMNPNDPMQNPEAFDMYRGVSQNVDADEVKVSHAHSHNESSLNKRNHTRRHLHHRVRSSQSSFTTEFGSEKSHYDNSVIHTDKKRSITKRGSSISSSSSSSHSRHRTGTSSFNDHKKHEATAIPKFGTWDVTDPNSGEGYTAIFSKIKEERKITCSHTSSTKTPPLHNCSNFKNQYDGPSLRLSKYCCCLFSSESS